MKNREFIPIARTCHEANKVICEYYDDNSQKPWDEIDDELKQSAIDGVVYAINNPKATPESMHENWCEFKRNLGWRYGPIKDIVAKVHPCLVPYSELPDNQKLKDSMFLGIVRSFGEVL